MIRLRGQFALLVATAAVLPLVLFGVVALTSLRTGTREAVVTGNVRVATRAAEQIAQYLDHAARTLQALAADLHGTDLSQSQQQRILRNYVLAFPSFREIAFFDPAGRPLATSRLTPTVLSPGAVRMFDPQGVAFAPITIDEDLLPRTTLTVQVSPGSAAAGLLVAEMRLEEMWRLVDRLRVGERGFGLLVDREGRLLAHGDPDDKPRVARREYLRNHPLAGAAQPDKARKEATAAALEYRLNDQSVLGVAAPIQRVGWTLIVEQPVAEAFAALNRLERQLFAAIALALLVTVALGYAWGRSFIAPISALLDGTKSIAEGRLDTRVRIERRDEFATLGEAFNGMADRLAALQDDARRQARQAMFGRIAAGLVHDLSHPIQNIGNNCRLILKMHDDPEYREVFRQTVERELQIVKRLFEDLRNLARPIPLEHFEIDLARAVGDAVDSMRSFAETAGLSLDYEPAAAITVEGDVFALGRVWRNLMLNAMQATAPGGFVRVSVERVDGQARVTVADSGCGIAPERLQAIFEDFTTTKRRGLGLGLPIAKKIVDQLGGTIAVTSEVGRGTTVSVDLPRVEPKARRDGDPANARVGAGTGSEADPAGRSQPPAG